MALTRFEWDGIEILDFILRTLSALSKGYFTNLFKSNLQNFYCILFGSQVTMTLD